jgi:hypothetical protein
MNEPRQAVPESTKVNFREIEAKRVKRADCGQRDDEAKRAAAGSVIP